MRGLLFGVVAVLVAVSTAGCASSAGNLKPDGIAPDQGAFFGRVTITNKGEDVTSHCYVRLTDAKDSKKAYLNLDGTGWVFSTVKPGPTYLSFAICTLGGLIKYNATYESRHVKFDVPGKGSIAYFGNVQIELNFNDSGIAAATIMAGSVGNALASSGASDKGHATVKNLFNDAVREYDRRFGGSAKALKPVMNLATPDPTVKRVQKSK